MLLYYRMFKIYKVHGILKIMLYLTRMLVPCDEHLIISYLAFGYP
jgi:hypothetical protein